jgi:hypothetical protein
MGVATLLDTIIFQNTHVIFSIIYGIILVLGFYKVPTKRYK